MKDIYKQIKYMVSYWIKIDKKSLFYFFLRIPAMVLFPLISAYIPKSIIECVQSKKNEKELLLNISLLCILLVITSWLSPFLKELLNGTSRMIRINYSIMSFNKYMEIDYEEFEKLEIREKAKCAQNFYYKSNSSSTEFIELCNQCLICIIGVLSSAIIVAKHNITILFIIFLLSIIELIFLHKVKGKEKITIDKRSKVYLKLDYFFNLGKNFSSSKDIKIFGLTKLFQYYLHRFIDESTKLISRFTKQNCLFSLIRAFTSFIRNTIIYLYIIVQVINKKIDIPDFIFYIGLITSISNWILKFVQYYSKILRCCIDCKNFQEFINIENPSNRDKNTNQSINSIDSIEFKHVYFKYHNSDEYAISDLSFKIVNGEKVAIVGENGAGKTTIINLICGLYKVTKGEILINGININELIQSSYHKLISIMFQEGICLPTTIAKNITLNNEYNQKKLNYVMQQAGIYKKVSTLPYKDKTNLVEEIYNDAIGMSGGEKQKLFLAKAIYRNAEMLIFDEPTAALDPISEEELYQRILKLVNNKLSIFVSHRLPITKLCDKILYISNGNIIETGSHNDLMNKKGKYYKLYQSQGFFYNTV